MVVNLIRWLSLHQTLRVCSTWDTCSTIRSRIFSFAVHAWRARTLAGYQVPTTPVSLPRLRWLTASPSRVSRRLTLLAMSFSSTLGTGLTSTAASSSSSSASSVPAATGTALPSPWTRPAPVPLSTYSATSTRRVSSIVACAWSTGTLRPRLHSLTRRLSTRTSTLSSII